MQVLCLPGAPTPGLTAYVPYDENAMAGGRILTLTPNAVDLDANFVGSGHSATVYHRINSGVVFHEFVHAFGNDPGSPGHNTFESPGNPPGGGSPVAQFAFATDRPYGCEASCFNGQGSGNASACK
jgi:hypothetical protein